MNYDELREVVEARAKQLTAAECARQLRVIAATDTQMFVSERAMMRRAADLLDPEASS